jgi:hypothetical protein
MIRYFGIPEISWDFNKCSTIRSIASALLFIFIIFSSCTKTDESLLKVEGHVSDIISHEWLNNAKVQILEWHQGFLWGGPFSIDKDSCFTDTNGHFLINFNSNEKYTYTLRISRDMYFKDEGYPVSITSVNRVNMGLFPKGYVKTHIINKIDTAQFIEIFITPSFHSQEVFRDGFINCNFFSKAFTDTSFVTTTIGGVENRLRILIFSDYVSDFRLVKDTSFITLKYDTIYLNTVLK